MTTVLVLVVVGSILEVALFDGVSNNVAVLVLLGGKTSSWR